MGCHRSGNDDRHLLECGSNATVELPAFVQSHEALDFPEKNSQQRKQFEKTWTRTVSPSRRATPVLHLPAPTPNV